jgi:hypothetical protein
LIPARLSIFTAVFAVVLAEVGLTGAHLGTIPSMAGFLAFLASFAIAVLALLIGLIGLAHTSSSERRPERPKAVAGIVLGLLIATPVGVTMWLWSSMPYPTINDITTDFENPPQFINPPELSPGSMKYDRARLEPIQARYYPKLGPLPLGENPDRAFARVKAAANVPPLVGREIAGQIPAASGWFIVYVDPATRTIEGVETSYLFRFRDDFVIQVRQGDNSNSSLVEMRSRSRNGLGDFGVNYNRIREFFGMLRASGDSAASSL